MLQEKETNEVCISQLQTIQFFSTSGLYVLIYNNPPKTWKVYTFFKLESLFLPLFGVIEMNDQENC